MVCVTAMSSFLQAKVALVLKHHPYSACDCSRNIDYCVKHETYMSANTLCSCSSKTNKMYSEHQNGVFQKRYKTQTFKK